MRRVAVQDQLYSIKNQLTDLGYEVVPFHYQGPVDAVLYIDDYQGLQNVNDGAMGNSLGAMMINVRGKDIEQIIEMIETRRYGRLFS